MRKEVEFIKLLKLVKSLFISDYIPKKAKLLVDIELDNGGTIKIGDIVEILKSYKHGYYHIENNNYSCVVYETEIEML